jgi:hypothetical protein
MQTTASIPTTGIGEGAMSSPSRTTVNSMPWYCVAAVLSVACIPVGVLWDISWHSTIGRDTFWTPAHMMIYVGGAVPGFLSGWLAFSNTFLRDSAHREPGVRLWGAYAPTGAWITIWGAVAMLTAGPFDDWWHNAYGLDVAILSPPHSLLALGMFGVSLGTLILVLSWQNRLEGAARDRCAWIFALMGGVMLTMHSTIVTEYSFPNQQRSVLFYQIACGLYPGLLVPVAWASPLRFAGTLISATYMGIMMLMIWILPLFAAHPQLAPIYHPVTSMVPPAFPLLMIIPAFAMDLLMLRAKRTAVGDARPTGAGRTLLAIELGVAFMVLLLAVQYPFSGFLLSDGADNWIFARGGHWPYYARPGSWMNNFWLRDTAALTWSGLGVALAIAIMGARWGLVLGDWMRQVRR